MFADPDTSPHSVVVTSPQPGEGKSTVSALLARALALRGGKVVLIDGDLRRPMIASLFDIDTGVGLTQVLSGAVPLDEALVSRPTPPGLLVLPAGRIPHNPSEVVGSERMRDLIAELSRSYLVIIDAPPALPVTDAMIMAQRVDGIIVITFMAKTRKEHLKKVLQLADNVNVRIFGIVLNGIPQGRVRRGLRLRDLQLRLGGPSRAPAAAEEGRRTGRRAAASRTETRPPTDAAATRPTASRSSSTTADSTGHDGARRRATGDADPVPVRPTTSTAPAWPGWSAPSG